MTIPLTDEDAEILEAIRAGGPIPFDLTTDEDREALAALLAEVGE